MSNRPKQSGPRRTIPSRTARPTQPAPVTRAVVLSALETWLIPVLSLVAAALFWALATFEYMTDAAGVVGVAAALLVLTLFSSFRTYFFAADTRQRQLSLGFAVFWGLFVLFAFYRHNFPGDPIAVGMLQPGGEPLKILDEGLYAVVVDGHFVAAEGQGNRIGHYRIDAVSGDHTDQSISGDFEDSFARQRLGRRGSTMVEVQHTAQRQVVRLPAGSALRIGDVDKTLEPALRVAIFPASPPWVFPVFGVAGLALAVVLEKWLDGDGSATMGVSVTYFAVDQYFRWASPHPQMKTLIGFVLVGGIIGAPLAAVLWRVVPRRWIVARR